MGYGYKLLRLRKDGTLGPLFINRRLRIIPLQTYEAEDHKTKGYEHRPGWHILHRPYAPHLSTKGRVWAKVRYTDGVFYRRPESQGGYWILAKTMQVLEILPHECVQQEIELCASIESTLRAPQQKL